MIEAVLRDGYCIVQEYLPGAELPSVSLPPGRTDEDYVLALLRETGILCVHGSGFGTKPEDGFFRLVFLAIAGFIAAN